MTLFGCVHYQEKSHCSVYRKCSVALRYAKNELVAGALSRTPLGELTTLPQIP